MKSLIILLIVAGSIAPSMAHVQADSAFYSNPTSKWLQSKTGSWSVTLTMTPTPDAAPMVIKSLKADRSMVGAFCLHELMEPEKGAPMPPFKRIADLDYNFNDTRWDYISIDSRITAGIMVFTYVNDSPDSIVSILQNFPHPGLGPKMTDRGKNMRARNVFVRGDANHDTVLQYWKMTDGKEWLAMKYQYVRK